LTPLRLSVLYLYDDIISSDIPVFVGKSETGSIVVGAMILKSSILNDRKLKTVQYYSSNSNIVDSTTRTCTHNTHDHGSCYSLCF
jgi:hypothetical protein